MLDEVYESGLYLETLGEQPLNPLGSHRPGVTFRQQTRIFIEQKPDAAQRVLKSAEAGYATIRRLYSRLENAGERKEIEEKLHQLRARLDALDRKLHSTAKP